MGGRENAEPLDSLPAVGGGREEEAESAAMGGKWEYEWRRRRRTSAGSESPRSDGIRRLGESV